MNSNTKNLKKYVSLSYRVVKPRTHVFCLTVYDEYNAAID